MKDIFNLQMGTPDGIWTHDTPRSGMDALTAELLETLTACTCEMWVYLSLTLLNARMPTKLTLRVSALMAMILFILASRVATRVLRYGMANKQSF